MSKRVIFKLLLFSVVLFIFSCSTTVAVGESPRSEGRPPGLIIASEKAVENGKSTLGKDTAIKLYMSLTKPSQKILTTLKPCTGWAWRRGCAVITPHPTTD